MQLFEDYLKENSELTFNDIFQVKNKWVKVTSDEKNKLADEFFELISVAYYPIGGHIKVRNAKDLIKSDWDVWQAIDYDSDPDAEIVIFGKSTPFGIKWSGVGHDGTKASKKLYLQHKIEAHKTSGNFTEVSEKLAEIFLNSGITYVNNEKDVSKVIGKKIEWKGESTEGMPGDGWYTRTIGGLQPKEKILVGMPKKVSKSSLSKL